MALTKEAYMVGQLGHHPPKNSLKSVLWYGDTGEKGVQSRKTSWRG